jgi:hypothetical protein
LEKNKALPLYGGLWMGFPENEVAADNRQRELEILSKPAGAQIVTKIKDAISIAPGVGYIANALGLSKILLEVGVSSVEDNLKYLGLATEAALCRIERNLEKHGIEVAEIRRRYEEPAFAESVEAAVLHTQRTRQGARLDRMAQILANSVEADDLDPEAFDDLARAAVELTDWDVQLLNDVRECESQLSDASGHLFMWWQAYWDGFGTKYPKRTTRAAAGALGKLQSFGFVYGAEGTSMAKSPVATLYRLSDDGERFLTRIQQSAGI